MARATERILAMPPASSSPTGRGSSPVLEPSDWKERSASRTAAFARAESSVSETKTSRSPVTLRRTNALSPGGSVTWRMRIMWAILPSRPGAGRQLPGSLTPIQMGAGQRVASRTAADPQMQGLAASGPSARGPSARGLKARGLPARDVQAEDRWARDLSAPGQRTARSRSTTRGDLRDRRRRRPGPRLPRPAAPRHHVT
jgi:hypothetical protein